jgi:hypothetical protein
MALALTGKVVTVTVRGWQFKVEVGGGDGSGLAGEFARVKATA